MQRETRIANIVLGALMVLSLLLLSLPLSTPVRSFKAGVGYLLDPLAYHGEAGYRRVAGSPERIRQLLQADIENQALRAELRRGEWLATTVSALSLENDRLRGALVLKAPAGRSPAWVHVMERDPIHWYRSLVVDAGSDRGVSLNDERPNARLTVNYDAAARWYAGGSLARAALIRGSSQSQAVAYGGWVGPAGAGRSIEIGTSLAGFAGISGYDFVEAYAGLLAERWSSRFYYSPNYYGRHVQVSYLELDSHVALKGQARVFAHVGALVPLTGAPVSTNKSRFDFRLGAGIARANWDLHVAATAVTPGGPYPAVYTGHRIALSIGVAYAF